jgi:2-dehydropantoate 2-reductase
MRIAIMGTGGVGGYFGGLLAKAGEDVTFIARGEHLRAILEQGLRVESVHGDFTVYPAQASDNPKTVGPVDLIIFATKTHQIEVAAEAMRPLIGPQTAVLPLHNGLDAYERTAVVLGPAPVLGGICQVGSQIAAPGVIRQMTQFRRVVTGELDGPITPRVERIVEIMRKTGIQAEASDDIQTVRWTKFIFIAPYSGVGAVTRVPIGEFRACPESRVLLEQAMREVEAVAAVKGVILDPDVVAKTLAFCDNVEPRMMASMQRDVLDGRPSELDSLVGVMVRFGAALGAPVPTFRFLYGALLPQERLARGMHPS